MINNDDFESILAPYIRSFIEEKNSLGYIYKTAELVLRRFDRYCISKNLADISVSRQFLDDWMTQTETESAFNLGKRISCVRQLMLYMTSVGINVYIPNDFCHFEKPLPHIFCNEELLAFFSVLDSYRPYSRMYFRLANEYKVLFRMIYSCGLRNSEACSIKVLNNIIIYHINLLA